MKTCAFCGKEVVRLDRDGLCHACYARRARRGTVEYAPTPGRARAAFQDNPDDPRHGTRNGYGNLRCRCDRCRQANTDAYRVIRAERPDLEAVRRVRAKAARIPRGVPLEMRDRWATERADLAVKQAHEMDELCAAQRAESITWIEDHKLQPMRDKLARAEERVAQLRRDVEQSA